MSTLCMIYDMANKWQTLINCHCVINLRANISHVKFTHNAQCSCNFMLLIITVLFMGCTDLVLNIVIVLILVSNAGAVYGWI